jgi:glycosyltransferase involved in cell wall biosynthesis
MRAGFVMLSSDEAPLLEHSLAAAAADGFDDGVVVDNASTDATAEVARRLGVERLRLDRRVPYTEAMNAGLRQMSTDAVALLQADTFVSPGYRASCLEALAEPDVGAVAPRLLRATGPHGEERLPLIDAAGMSVDRRRKNSLVGHGSPEGAYAVAAEVFGADGAAARRVRRRNNPPLHGSLQLQGVGHPARGDGLGLERRAGLGDRLRAGASNVREGRDDAAWGPNNRFVFPTVGGTGEIYTRIADRLADRIRYDQEVVAVDPAERQLRMADGGEYGYDALVSTAPLDRLVMALNDWMYLPQNHAPFYPGHELRQVRDGQRAGRRCGPVQLLYDRDLILGAEAGGARGARGRGRAGTP